MAKAKKEVKEQPVEQVLWAAVDKLRKNMDAAEYKHIVLGLIFLKYISDNFYELYNKLKAGEGEYAGADPDIHTSIGQRMFSMYHHRLGGITYEEGQNLLPSVKMWTRRWTQLKRTTPPLRVYCQKNMLRRNSISNRLAG